MLVVLVEPPPRPESKMMEQLPSPTDRAEQTMQPGDATDQAGQHDGKDQAEQPDQFIPTKLDSPPLYRGLLRGMLAYQLKTLLNKL